MDPVKDNSHPAAAFRPALAILALLAVLKGAAAARFGSEILLAQACFTAGELLVLISVLPALRREGCSGEKMRCRSAYAPVKRGFIYASALLLLGAGLLRQAVLLLNGREPAELSGMFALALLFFAAAELFLWSFFSSRARRRRSLSAAAVAGSYRADLFLLAGTAVIEVVSAWRGWPALIGLAVVGLGILVLLQATEMVRRGFGSLVEPQPAERLLRPVRERVAGIRGVVAIHKIAAQPAESEDGLNLRLDVIVEDGTPGIERITAAVRQRVAESFREVSSASVQTVAVSTIRESIRRRARYLH